MFKRTCLYLFAALLLNFFSISPMAQNGEKKVVYGVLVDNTRSMEKQFSQVMLIGKEVVKRISKRGTTSLFNFITKRDTGSFVISTSQDAYEGGNFTRAEAALGVEWSQDEDALNQCLDSLSVVRGHTNLFGAINTMAESLNTKASAENGVIGDKIIILITDGEHRPESFLGSSYSTEDERWKQEKRLIKQLKDSGIQVYAVGLVQELNAYGGFGGKTTKEKAMTFLEKVTKETGGRVIFPKSRKMAADTLIGELLAQ